jgi:Fes/CIP4, and EFC/F-BAR homology domain
VYRVAAEEDYARRLLKISKMSLGSKECGTLKASMQAVKQEVETMAVAHAEVASAMKRDLEDAVVATAVTIKERRKTVDPSPRSV